MPQLDLDRTAFLAGPALYLQNPFRLSQMPVEIAERKLGQRLKAIEAAENMGLDLPAGLCPIFPADPASAVLREALHRMRDPAFRLAAEIFWFWPSSFSGPDEENRDEGLSLLAENRVPEAIQFWENGEGTRLDVVSSHNLAVLYHVLAVRTDDGLISSETGLRLSPLKPEKPSLLSSVKKSVLKVYHRNSPEEEARRYWGEALGRWKRLSTNEGFWRLVEARILRINSPQLPSEAAQWFQKNLMAIVYSVNAVLTLQAAERSLRDHVERQRRILKDGGSDEAEVNDVLEALTAKERAFVKTASDMARDEAHNNPRQGHTLARALADQVRPILGVLQGAFPQGLTESLNALHDTVADAILRCDIVYTVKTQDWVTSEALDDLAETFARSESTLGEIRRSRETTLKAKERGNDWCTPGYFELPEPCIEALEKLRSYAAIDKYQEAIDGLRDCLLDLNDLPATSEFKVRVSHCLAYCFRNKGVAEHNSALERFNQRLLSTLEASVKYESKGNGPAGNFCAKCGKGFVAGESFIRRSMEGFNCQFCNSCNVAVNSELEPLERELDGTRQSALELLTLANALDPKYKSVAKDLATVRENCNGRNIRISSLHDLKVRWNLFTAEEAVDLLVSGRSGGQSAIGPHFANVAWIVPRQSESRRKQTLSALFTKVTKGKETLSAILPFLFGDDYIFSEFIKQVVADERAAGQSVASQLLLLREDHAIRLAAIKLLEPYQDSPHCASLRASLLESLGPLARKYGLTEPIDSFSLTSGRVGGLLSGGSVHGLETTLILQVTEGVVESRKKGVLEVLLRQIETHPQASGWFYRNLLGPEGSATSRAAVIQSLVETKDLALQIQALKRMRNAFDHGNPAGEATERIERAVREGMSELGNQELGSDPLAWFTGRISGFLTEAAGYSPEFESTLVAAIAASASRAEQQAFHLMQLMTARANDRRFFLALIEGEYPGVDEPGRLTFCRVMMRHRDPAIRLSGLRGIERYADLETCILFSIQGLADSDETVRQTSRTLLESHPNESCGPAFEAVFTQVPAQLRELEALLGRIESQLTAKTAPPVETLVNRLVLIDDEAVSLRVRAYLDRFYPAWTNVGFRSRKRCLAWLRWGEANGRMSGRAGYPSVVSAKHILDKYRSRSFLKKLAVWVLRPVHPAAGHDEVWWEPALADILEAPAGSGPGRPRLNSSEAVQGAQDRQDPRVVRT